jgi:hypothetical protein
MGNKTALGLAALIVILNGIIGHYFAPNGILLTPIVLTITASLVCFGTKKIKHLFISFLTYFFVALNDVSIKLFSGGTHDSEGLALINMFLLIGLAPTFSILWISILTKKVEKIKQQIIALIAFILLMTIHFILFKNL